VARRISSPLFVGRTAELEALDAVLAAARAGAASTVLVSGEAGIGKTRLLEEFASRARAGGARVLIGTCIELGDGELPHAPLAAILRELRSELRPEELAGVLGPARAVLDPAGPEGQAGRLELVLDMLSRLGEIGPAVIAIEDLHWADRSTRDLLAFLIRSLRREPIVIVATYRSDELHRRHPLRTFLTAHASEVEQLEIARFDQDELTRLVTAIRGATPTRELAAQLLARSEGNPFLAEELLAAGGTGLPDTLREVLMARVERVSDRARAALRIAACAGAGAPHRLFSATAGLAELELEDALRETVTHHVLVRKGEEAYAFRHALLGEAVYADMLPSERARLHAAIARALDEMPELASESAATRAAELAYHWKAAHQLDEALAASVAAGRSAAKIAAFPEAQRHFEYALAVWDRVEGAEARSGMDRIDLTRRAADVANLAADRNRAIALARDAAARLDAERDPVRAALVQERLGRYLWLMGREDEAAAACNEAVVTLPADPPSAERARVVAAEGLLLMLRGHALKAIARCEEALAVARAVGARAEQAHALNTLGACRSGLGEHEAGEACLREALAIALERELFDDIGRAYVNLGDCIDQAGRIQEAARLALDGIEASRSLGLGTPHRSMLLSEAANRMFRAGKWDDAERLADRALALRVGGYAEGSAHAIVAQIAAARGNPTVAWDELAHAHATFTTASAMWTAPVDATAAELELSAGRAAAARDVVARGLARTEDQEFPFFTARLHWVGVRVEAELGQESRARFDHTGELEARSRGAEVVERIAGQIVTGGPGRPAPELLLYAALCVAELTRVAHAADPAAWDAPIAHADALAIPALGAYARWRQAEAALTLGQRHAAVEPLRAAASTAAQLGARTLREEIGALAGRGRVELGDVADPADVDSLNLTPRERDVLRLVAAGRTNREIGTALYMSPKTASVHVSRILRKLNARGRVEAAAIAHRRGLE
jgi:DNA-binding CsgD family transcriptional regulator/tetratricopeptide (TPR) repeat protein